MQKIHHWIDLFKRKFWAFESLHLELGFAKYSSLKFAKSLGNFLKKKMNWAETGLGPAGRAHRRKPLPRTESVQQPGRLHLLAGGT